MNFDRPEYIVELRARNVDQGGGTKHKTASAAGMKGFLATKHPEDCCGGTDGCSRIGNLDLEVFLGIKSLNLSLPLLQKK